MSFRIGELLCFPDFCVLYLYLCAESRVVLLSGFSPMWAGTRPIVTKTVKAPTTKPAPPTGNLQKLPVCDKCGNGIVWVKTVQIICDSHSDLSVISTNKSVEKITETMESHTATPGSIVYISVNPSLSQFTAL